MFSGKSSNETAIRAVNDDGSRSIAQTLSAGVIAAAFSLALMQGPAFAADEAKKDQTAEAEAAKEAVEEEPMTLIVSLDDQKVDVYRGTTLITSSKVSTGMPGHTTKSGVFTVLEKKRHHYSNLYNGAPMPWMQRLTWSGTALHAGVVPGYPASHGCIRLPRSFAPKLFDMTSVGGHVVVARNHPKPLMISHTNLFQTLPMPTPPVVSKDDRKNQKAGLDKSESQSFADAASPLILAKATLGEGKAETATDAVDGGSLYGNASADKIEDTGHAIDPNGPAGVNPAVTAKADAVQDHAIKVDRPPSLVAKKSLAGGLGAAVAAAEPRNDAPLRILVTKATKRDRIRGVQFQLADLGYLEPQKFDGTFGSLTIDAIKSFQRDHDMPRSGAVTDDVVQAIYAANGKDMPPNGHLFVRRDFDGIYDAPVTIRQTGGDLGTHVFTAMDFSAGDTSARWMSVSTNNTDPYGALDRIVIPEDTRQWISERLTPGSSLIIADTAVNTAALPKGADYVVLAKDPGKPAYVRREVRPQPRYEPRYEPRPRSRRRTGGPFWFRF